MGHEARAKQTAAADLAPFLITIPIAKVDKAKRQVSGPATCEVLDKQGEIVDYATAKAFFMDPELWPGNIREMHLAKAVGKKVSVECNDDDKVITLTARVSTGAPDTWEKVLDGTLSMYSIGGSGKRVAEKTADGKAVKRLFLEQLAEVSLVDNGANPAAKFTIVKSVDGVITDAEPAELEAPAVDDQAGADPVAKAAAALDAARAAAQPIAYVPGAVRALVCKLAGAVGTDRAAEKQVVIAKAVTLGAEAVAELPEAWRPDAVKKSGPESYDIDRALSAISTLENLIASEYYETRYLAPGATPDPVQIAQLGMLKTAVDATLRFLVSEHEAQFAADQAAGTPEIVSTDTAVAMFMKSLEVVQKAGARHSKGDKDMIQKVHDLSGDLGAVCKDMGDDDGGDDADKAAKVAKAALAAPTDSTKDPTMNDEITKLTTALTESQAVVAKQAETIEGFEKRLKLIEDGPAQGGPVRSAEATKALGGPGGSSEGEVGKDDVIKALQALAADGDPAVRELVAKRLVSLQHATGRIDFSAR